MTLICNFPGSLIASADLTTTGPRGEKIEGFCASQLLETSVTGLKVLKKPSVRFCFPSSAEPQIHAYSGPTVFE